VAELIGLDTEHVAQLRGRVDHERYAKLLLQDQGRVLDRYDGTQAYPDPTPENPALGESDPAVTLLDSRIAPAFLDYLRHELGYRIDRPYIFHSQAAFDAWDPSGSNGLLIAINKLEGVGYG
jgi:hypothetical protein